MRERASRWESRLEGKRLQPKQRSALMAASEGSLDDIVKIKIVRCYLQWLQPDCMRSMRPHSVAARSDTSCRLCRKKRMGSANSRVEVELLERQVLRTRDFAAATQYRWSLRLKRKLQCS
jgi:hypothetical protein